VQCESSKIVRLMQRRQRNQRFEFCEQLRSYAFRPYMPGTSVNDTMPDGGERATVKLLLRPRDEEGEYVARRPRRARSKRERCHRPTVAATGSCGGSCTNSLNLASNDGAIPLEKCKFQRGRPRIYHTYQWVRGAHLWVKDVR
jgi:hypothetical protein